MSEPTTFVTTKEIRAAVDGHETEVLDALGIDWKACRPHIDCPYPEHGGKGDWRWDVNKKKAFCTCQNGHADGIFDILAKCEGVEFEAAKIRVADIIGRSDLIKTKGGKGQKTDAFSLMNPSNLNEDRGLPRAYLAHRLGVEPADVLMPATHVAGWRALAYFDPPAKQGNKPVHVGDYPCAVFGTVAASGGTHAHRIYVAPGGAGKAELGKTADGRDRDPKKSAKVAEGENTSGRSVLWGDAVKAERIVLCEGIETAAAVAHALRAEIGAGDVAVAAAIATAGVQAFQPYAATKRVTVAADRDEEPKPGKPHATRAGEKAAREFGMRRHEEILVDIALPGAPGSGTDWLDVLRADGVEAVRAGIEAATPFRPTQAEIDERARRAEQRSRLAEVSAEYPIPRLNTMTVFYDHAEDGKVWIHKLVTKGKGENAEIVPVPICTPFGATARLRYEDQAESYGLRVALLDMRGHRRLIDLDRGDLAKTHAAEARTALFSNGLRAEAQGEHTAVELLKATHPTAEIAVVRKTGWHPFGSDGDAFFVCPDGEVIGAPSGATFELQRGAQISPHVAHGGTFDGWKASVSVAATVPDCQHFTLGIIAGFVGPILSLCGLDTCGINLSGKTSLGKTTAQRLAVSVWSKADPTKKDSLLQSAKATANSMEAVAARANGTVMVLDELGHITGAEVGKMIYLLAGSVGKGRMTASATMRDSYSWSTFALLSAESSLEEKIRADGEVMKGGQAARFPDVDVTGVNGQVSTATMAKIEDVRHHYGHAGPAFVRALIGERKHLAVIDLHAAITAIANRLARRGVERGEPDPALLRAARPFALLYIAGGIAKELDVLPKVVDVTGAVTWAWDRFKASNEAIVLDPEKQAIQNLRRWIAERWNTSIHCLEADTKPTRDAVAWWDDDAVYIPDTRLVEAAGGALKEVQVAKVLNDAGFIAKRKSDKHISVSYVPKLGQIKAYALTRKQFGRNSGGQEDLRVIDGGLL